MGAGKDSRRRRRARWGISGTDARLGGAAAVVASGLIHLHLGVVAAPDLGRDGLGRLFVAYGVVAVLVGLGVTLRRDAALRVAAIALLSASTLAFVLGRLGVDVLGSSSTGLAPSPQAPLAMLCAVVGCVLLAMTFVHWVGAGEPLKLRTSAAIAALALAVPTLSTVAWSREGREVVAVESGSIPITASTATAATAVTTSTAVATSTTAVTTTTTTSGPTAIRPTTEAPTTTSVAMTVPPTTIPPTTVPPPPTTVPTTTVPPITVRVRIGDFGFDPEVQPISVGTTIEWYVDGSWDHSVVAVDGTFDSGLLDGRGDTFSHRFDAPGWYPYVDGFESGNEGVIVVNP